MAKAFDDEKVNKIVLDGLREEIVKVIKDNDKEIKEDVDIAIGVALEFVFSVVIPKLTKALAENHDLPGN